MLSFSVMSAFTLLAISTRVFAQNDTAEVRLKGKGPVIDTNFPDPTLSYDKNTSTWYAFSTQSFKVNIQMATSKDFSTWKLHDNYDALPTIGTWAQPVPHAAVWAPDVNQRPDGSWVMYYAALHRHKHARRHCIGAATAANIAGPYIPQATPLVCDLVHGGNIDPNLFRDPLTDAAYLVYKTDGDTIGHGGSCGNTVHPIAPTPLYMQLLDPETLVDKTGPPIFLFSNGPLDGPNVERPSLLFINGTYFALYNSRCFQSLSYRVNYVSCVGASSVTDCHWADLKYAQDRWRAPLLQTGDTAAQVRAPGSVDTDGERMVFHADVDEAYFVRMRTHGKVRRNRAMFAAGLEVDPEDGSLLVKGLY